MTLTNHVFCQGVTLDPAHPSTIYLCVCAYEVRAKAAFSRARTAAARGPGSANSMSPCTWPSTPMIPSICTAWNGVRGGTEGFWVSNDGGETWASPPGFKAATQKPVGTSDLYSIDVDPTDFKHVLVSFHSPWADSRNCGVLESKDGGKSWIVHNPPDRLRGRLRHGDLLPL